MKRTTIAAVAAVLLLTLTGCAGTAVGSEDASPAPVTTERAEPLAAETPAAAESDDVDSEQAFLDYVRENLPTPTSIPDATDEQLLAAGQEACTRLAAGESADGMVVVDGEQPWENGYYYDSSAIVGGASRHLCAS